MTQKAWLKAIDKNSITSSDLLLIADLCGIDVAVSLLKNASGLCINIPKDGFRTAKRKYILDNYTGTKESRQKLAIECDVTEGYIRYLARKNKKENINLN